MHNLYEAGEMCADSSQILKFLKIHTIQYYLFIIEKDFIKKIELSFINALIM